MVTLRNNLSDFILPFTEAQGTDNGLDADSGLGIEAKSWSSKLLAVILRKFIIFLSFIYLGKISAINAFTI